MDEKKRKERMELIERRDALVKRYIGVWAKPKRYYDELELLNRQIKEAE